MIVYAVPALYVAVVAVLEVDQPKNLYPALVGVVLLQVQEEFADVVEVQVAYIVLFAFGVKLAPAAYCVPDALPSAHLLNL